MRCIIVSNDTPLGTILRSHVAVNIADNWSSAISKRHSLHFPNSGGGNTNPPCSYFTQSNVTLRRNLYLVDADHCAPFMFNS